MIEACETVWETDCVADDGSMPSVFRAYLRVLLGPRNQEVLAGPMGVERSAVGHLLNGRRKISPTHLQGICDAWNITPSRMLADMARVAFNIETGRPAGEGVGGYVTGAETTEQTSARRRSKPEH